MPDEVRELVLGFVGLLAPVILFYLRKLARKLSEMVEVQLTDQTWRNVDATLEVAVHHAEEFARKQLRRGAPKASSGEKLQVARETARRVAASDLRPYDDATLDALLEAKLQKLRG